MILIRVTRADLVLPRYLYHQIKTVDWSAVDSMIGKSVAWDSKFSYAKNINMKRQDSGESCKLNDVCDVIDNFDGSTMRGDITIDEDNSVNIFE